jgi:hypothetical protein
MNRTRFFTLATLATAAVLSLSACSSGDVPVGSTDQAIQKSKKGAPTGNGTTCSWDDSVSSEGTTTSAANGTFNVGDSVPAPDGCNTCACTAQGIRCTMRGCPSPGPGDACTYGGKTYAADATFRSTDGCNSCSCASDGSVICTEVACAPVVEPCQKTGCSGELCADHDIPTACLWTESYACYQTATCARQADGQCGFTQTPALTQCLGTKK